MTPAELIALASLAAQGIKTAMSIASTIQKAVQESKDLSEAEKGELLSAIREAQASVAAWE